MLLDGPRREKMHTSERCQAMGRCRHVHGPRVEKDKIRKDQNLKSRLVDVIKFVLASGGALRRHGWTQRGKLVRLVWGPIVSTWHRSDVCIFSRRGPSRSILDHLAKIHARNRKMHREWASERWRVLVYMVCPSLSTCLYLQYMFSVYYPHVFFYL